MANDELKVHTLNIRDLNPLEHITSDLSKTQHNFEAMLQGIVTWANTCESTVAVRLATDTEPYFVDYVFPSRAGYGSTSTLAVEPMSGIGEFSYGQEIPFVAVHNSDDSGIPSDRATIRVTVTDSKGWSWGLYEDAMVYDDGVIASRDYSKGSYIRIPVDATSNRFKLVVALQDIAAGDELVEFSNIDGAIKPWRTNNALTMTGDCLVTYGGKCYILVGQATNRAPDYVDNDNWKLVGEVIPSNDSRARSQTGFTLKHGHLYVYSVDALGKVESGTLTAPEAFIYTGNDVKLSGEGPYPYKIVDGVREDDTENWVSAGETVRSVMVKYIMSVSGNTVIKRSVTTDTRGILALTETQGEKEGDMRILANLTLKLGDTEPQRGVQVFGTSNFSNWPESTTTVWKPQQVYDYSDDFTARMVMHHADPDTKRTIMLNYDGPDLDRGLAIYLPVEDSANDSNGVAGTVEPVDGYTFEFMFRIWPNPAYNGHTTADGIINKAQIYVYSAPSTSEEDISHAKVIAKFSMARLTNFYVWAENVAVPNRPVFYKAKFIYCADDRQWKTYDYYQIPDCVFISPKGFVDPTERSKSDGYNGVETAGFPLMQDPFGGLDMNAVLLNRIQE